MHSNILMDEWNAHQGNFQPAKLTDSRMSVSRMGGEFSVCTHSEIGNAKRKNGHFDSFINAYKTSIQFLMFAECVIDIDVSLSFIDLRNCMCIDSRETSEIWKFDHWNFLFHRNKIETELCKWTIQNKILVFTFNVWKLKSPNHLYSTFKDNDSILCSYRHSSEGPMKMING